MSQIIYGIHWFRRDLRVQDNGALQKLWLAAQKNVLGLFVIDQRIKSRPDFSQNRYIWLLKNLESLKLDLQKIGSDLLLIEGNPEVEIPALIEQLKLKAKFKLTHFSFNEDVEPFAVHRDAQIKNKLENAVQIITHIDYSIGNLDLVKKDDKSSPYYQVFTPFKNKWREILKIEKLKLQKNLTKTCSLKWQDLGTLRCPLKNLNLVVQSEEKKLTVSLPAPGFNSGLLKAEKFLKLVNEYETARDIPSVDGTSKLSLYFKFGVISPKQVFSLLRGRLNKSKFADELIWRDFYYYILKFFPYVENHCFKSQFDKIKWENNKKHFEAWCQGKTGYPIVDAGMRQLVKTGWMHNRLRMITASFLVKDLLVDWRWGQQFFMNHLIDGDLAANNGGWQWCAGTGVDPMPYFRIFNPVLQGQKFDPQGKFIRAFVPELSHLDKKQIHFGDGNPIVNHDTQKKLFLSHFKSALQT